MPTMNPRLFNRLAEALAIIALAMLLGLQRGGASYRIYRDSLPTNLVLLAVAIYIFNRFHWPTWVKWMQALALVSLGPVVAHFLGSLGMWPPRDSPGGEMVAVVAVGLLGLAGIVMLVPRIRVLVGMSTKPSVPEAPLVARSPNCPDGQLHENGIGMCVQVRRWTKADRAIWPVSSERFKAN